MSGDWAGAAVATVAAATASVGVARTAAVLSAPLSAEILSAVAAAASAAVRCLLFATSNSTNVLSPRVYPARLQIPPRRPESVGYPSSCRANPRLGAS